MPSLLTRSGLGIAAMSLVLPLSAGPSGAVGSTSHEGDAVRFSPSATVKSVTDAPGDQLRRQPGWRQHPRLRKVADLRKLTISNNPQRRMVVLRHRLAKIGAAPPTRNQIWSVTTDLSRGNLKYQIHYFGDEGSVATFVIRDGAVVGTMCNADRIRTRVNKKRKTVVTSVPWKCFRGSKGGRFKAVAFSSVAHVQPAKSAVQPVANDRTRALRVPIKRG